MFHHPELVLCHQGRKRSTLRDVFHLTAFTFPLGPSLTCTYSLALPSLKSRENAASIFCGIIILMINLLIYYLGNEKVKEGLQSIRNKSFLLGHNF